MIDRNRLILRRNTRKLRWCWIIIVINATFLFHEASAHRLWLLYMTITVMALLAAGMIFLADSSRRLASITAQLEYWTVQQRIP